MQTAIDTPIEVFMAYAGSSPQRWQEALKLEVTHATFGVGKIVEVDEFLWVEFAGGSKHFDLPSLSNARFFTDMRLPEHLETPALLKRRRGLNKDRLGGLRLEYGATVGDTAEDAASLFPILLKVNAGTRLDDTEVEWLEARSQFATLALLFQKLYKKDGAARDALAAGSYWRRAGEDVKALAYLKPLRFSVASDEAARLTMRASGHLAAGALAWSEKCATASLKLEETAEAHNLLGNVYTAQGNLDQANEQFAAAQALIAPDPPITV